MNEELVQAASAEGIDRFVVGGLVHRDFGGVTKLLILERVADDFMGGIEELPSGKVDEGESLLESLARELKEETGLDALGEPRYLFSFDYTSGSGRRTRQFNYSVEVGEGTVVLNPGEHSGYRWLEPSEYASSRLTPNVVELLVAHQA